ncbi:hypothetical protein [Parvibaculum sp.]|uniref:DUF7303 family protein n=1 Tax=Parvibaculum sp. TaxID=2024848 RepID=UPI000C49A1A5|nr:hypothetical protein [Parvibaculum sp.]MAM95714.1 hypothetical protein [Parvibaculum sp.]|tara:strand:+ start:2283 stop:2534 length:252 start_codon:yes stop_codon:yes gene_type:complete
MTINIDKGVPVPPVTYQTRRLYPFEEMQPGDSFFVQTKDAAERIRKRQSVAAAAKKFRKDSEPNTLRFTTRQVRNGVRCWRIE